MNTCTLIKILETSVKRHGEKTPVTLGHLLNIVKMVDRAGMKMSEHEEAEHQQLLHDIDPLKQDYTW